MKYCSRRFVALSPEKKHLRNEHVLQEYVANNPWPDFDEVYAYVKEMDENYYDWAENRLEYDADTLHIREVVREIWDTHEPVRQLPESGSEEWELFVEAHKDELVWAVSDALFRENAELLYHDAINRLEQDKIELWRAVTLREDVDPARLARLGVYWAYEEGSAEAHWGGSGPTVVFHAEVDARYANRYGTIAANLDLSIGEDESEISLFSYAPIFVFDVELEDGTKIEINDWRRT